MNLRKTTLLLSIALLCACSKQPDPKSKSDLELNQAVKLENLNNIDWSVLKEDKGLSIKDYEIDDTARVYVLGECTKLVEKKIETPPQCLAAATAEYNTVIKELNEVQETQSESIKLTDAEKSLIEKGLVEQYTYKKTD